jgi:hypothetical protein
VCNVLPPTLRTCEIVGSRYISRKLAYRGAVVDARGGGIRHSQFQRRPMRHPGDGVVLP